MQSARRDDLIAVIAVLVILGLTGIGFVIWMSVLGFKDMPGLSVGIIFIVLTALQTGISAFWWVATGKKQKQYDVNNSLDVKEVEMKTMAA